MVIAVKGKLEDAIDSDQLDKKPSTKGVLKQGVWAKDGPLPDGPWRDAPVTEKQKEILTQYGCIPFPANRGKASDLIDFIFSYPKRHNHPFSKFGFTILDRRVKVLEGKNGPKVHEIFQYIIPNGSMSKVMSLTDLWRNILPSVGEDPAIRVEWSYQNKTTLTMTLLSPDAFWPMWETQMNKAKINQAKKMIQNVDVSEVLVTPSVNLFENMKQVVQEFGPILPPIFAAPKAKPSPMSLGEAMKKASEGGEPVEFTDPMTGKTVLIVGDKSKLGAIRSSGRFTEFTERRKRRIILDE